MNEHLVFYDGQCGFCDHIVQILLKIDTREIFSFAPLQGETAARLLKHLPPEMKNKDSLVLIENYRSHTPKYFILGEAALRIGWLLGGFWALAGWISWLPSFLYDWLYRLIARNRYRLFRNHTCIVPNKDKGHRFLP